MIDQQKTTDSLKFLIESVSVVQKKEDIFDLICKISKETEKYTKDDLENIRSHNLHVDLIWDVFHCEFFLNNLKKISNDGFHEDCLEEKEVVQLFLRLSFFLASVLMPVLSKDTLFFLSQQLSRSVKNIHRKFSSGRELAHLLFTMEEVNYDVRYRFEKKTPIVLDTDFLNMNQISSRIFVGSLFMYNFGYLVLPNLIKKIAIDGKHPRQLFRYTSSVIKKSKAYEKHDFLLTDRFFTKDRKEAVKRFLFLLKDQNIENLLFLVKEMSLDYRNYNSALHNKIDYATLIKDKVQRKFEYMHVFTGGDTFVGDWSNKVFLNSIRFLSVLESIKDARDEDWQRKTFTFFFSQWLKELNKIVNYHNIEEIEKNIIYVEGISDEIILKNAYDKLYPKHNSFIFYSTGGKHELNKKINAVQINDLGKKTFGIFDFDDAYNEFNGLRSGEHNFTEIEGKDDECIFRSRISDENQIYALLLPVPKERKSIASRELKEKSMLSIEMLFSDKVLNKHKNLQEKKVPGGIIKNFSGDKRKFAEKTKNFSKEDFINFTPLFKKLFELVK